MVGNIDVDIGVRSVPIANLILHVPKPEPRPHVMLHVGVVRHHREMIADAMGNNGVKPILRRIADAGMEPK